MDFSDYSSIEFVIIDKIFKTEITNMINDNDNSSYDITNTKIAIGSTKEDIKIDEKYLKMVIMSEDLIDKSIDDSSVGTNPISKYNANDFSKKLTNTIDCNNFVNFD